MLVLSVPVCPHSPRPNLSPLCQRATAGAPIMAATTSGANLWTLRSFFNTSPAALRSPSNTEAGIFGESLNSTFPARFMPGNKGIFPSHAGTSTLCMSRGFNDIPCTISKLSSPILFLAPKALRRAALNFLGSASAPAGRVNLTLRLSVAPIPTKINSVSSLDRVSVSI